MGSRAQSKERQLVFISKSPEVVKGEGKENERAVATLAEKGHDQPGLSALSVEATREFAGGLLTPVPWPIYMTVKYDTRSAVPALLITRLVTA